MRACKMPAVEQAFHGEQSLTVHNFYGEAGMPAQTHSPQLSGNKSSDSEFTQ
jgi:hypothetical protein